MFWGERIRRNAGHQAIVVGVLDGVLVPRIWCDVDKDLADGHGGVAVVVDDDGVL